MKIDYAGLKDLCSCGVDGKVKIDKDIFCLFHAEEQILFNRYTFEQARPMRYTILTAEEQRTVLEILGYPYKEVDA
ncbi:MAG: hypothetical protein AABY22_18320 [Nanoarchaeota archaeon]